MHTNRVGLAAMASTNSSCSNDTEIFWLFSCQLLRCWHNFGQIRKLVFDWAKQCTVVSRAPFLLAAIHTESTSSQSSAHSRTVLVVLLGHVKKSLWIVSNISKQIVIL